MAITKKNNKKMSKKTMKNTGSVEMYCVRCRKKVMCADPKKETLKNGRCMMRATCPGCKGKCTKFVKC